MNEPHRFGYHFAILHRLKLALIKEGAASLGLQVSQAPFLLILLKARKPLTQDEISNKLIIDKSATTRALDQLEKLGFVTRQVNPDCRRQKLVNLTQKAREIGGKLQGIHQSATDIMSKGFTSDELNTLVDLINRMVNNAKTELEIPL